MASGSLQSKKMIFARIFKTRYKGINGQILITLEYPTQEAPYWAVLLRTEIKGEGKYSARKFRTEKIARDYLAAYTAKDAAKDFEGAFLFTKAEPAAGQVAPPEAEAENNAKQ